MPPQGLAYFPGINQIVSASIDFVHGISPSRAQITLAPQPNFIGAGGTFSMTFADVALDWPDCRIDSNSLLRNERGEVWQLQILDRRWKWVGLGKISGRYNVRKPDGTLDAATEKTPQELAQLLLDAMGESGAEVSDLPNDTRPAIEWDGDVPAEQLGHLAEGLGCRVVLQLDNRVALRLAGQGAALPLDGVLENSLTIDPPERPDELGILCGHTRYQVDLELYAVGLDTDGTIKPIDELSYQPTGGWTFHTIPYANNVVDPDARELARRTVYRWYQILLPSDILDHESGENIAITDGLNQVYIESEQIETTLDAEGHTVNKPAAVIGVYAIQQKCMNSAVTIRPDLAAYPHRFTIDAERGLVIFDDPVYRNTLYVAEGVAPAKTVAAEATLRLRTALQLRRGDTRAWQRYEKLRDEGTNFGTEPRYEKHDEIILQQVFHYDAGYGVSQITTNQAEIDIECDYYLAALENDYELALPQSVKYPGLRPIEMDGAIQHATFEVGGPFCTTTVSRNNERVHAGVVSYKEMRMLQRAKELARQKAIDARKPRVSSITHSAEKAKEITQR